MHTLRWNFLPVSLTFLGSSEIFKGPLFIHGCYHFHAAKFCQNPNFFFLACAPCADFLLSRGMGETCHRVHLRETVAGDVSAVPRCALLAHTPLGLIVLWLLGYCLGELGKVGLAFIEEEEGWAGSPLLRHPQHPKNSGGDGRSWVSLKVRLWVKVVLVPASFPFWPPRDARRCERVPGMQPSGWCRCAGEGLRHRSSTKQHRQWIQVV